jgi:hypothetical protein
VAVRDVYLRVVRERVLPKGMYFSRIPVMVTGTLHFEVDWRDLTLTALPAGTKDAKIGLGYNYRLRARFISSRPLTDEERKENEDRMKQIEKIALPNVAPSRR